MKVSAQCLQRRATLIHKAPRSMSSACCSQDVDRYTTCMQIPAYAGSELLMVALNADESGSE